MEYVAPALVLALACGFWVVVQRLIARLDPGQPGVEGDGHGHSCSGCSAEKQAGCASHRPQAETSLSAHSPPSEPPSC